MVNIEKWDDIEKIYFKPNIKAEKGSIIRSIVETDGDIEEFDKLISIKTFLKFWEYAYGDKTIKPFKLLEYKRQGNTFQAVLQYVNKSKEIDEVKLLCKDIANIYNHENIHLLKWTNIG